MASDLQVVFGQRVREERQRGGITQAELAKRVKMQQPDLCDLEKGRHSPTLETVGRIAKALDIAPSELLSQDSIRAYGNLPNSFRTPLALLAWFL